MSSPSAPRAPASLCTTCAHVQLVRSAKGSVFFLCTRSRANPSELGLVFPKYPPQPVVRCRGHEPAPPDDARGAERG